MAYKSNRKSNSSRKLIVSQNYSLYYIEQGGHKMESFKIRYGFITALLGFYLFSYSGIALAQSISAKEVRQAMKEQGLAGRFTQDSASKKWFLYDWEGDTYKFDENSRKWVKLGEPSAPSVTPTPGRRGDAPDAVSDNIIRDKYYVAVKTLRLFQQPERGAREGRE